LDAVHAIYREAVVNASWLPATTQWSTDFTTVCKGETVFVCCDVAGEVLGFISVYEQGQFIHHLYVASSCRGRGVGSTLLDSLESWLPMPWRLKCMTANQGALALYLARGWIEEERTLGPDGTYVLLGRFADGSVTS